MPEKPKREGRRFVRRKHKVSPGSARRSGGSSHRPRGTSHPIVKRIKPSADPRLKRVFAQIGVPDIQPIKPDPFQVKALHTIGRCDCLVSAPTGSGKTWIAEEAIARILKKGGKAWYASPLKALTNSKYLEFMDRFGQQAVGILTGDRKENANAPILTGTTEILRNQLYDAMHEGTNFASDLVILDEAHFLGDQDRGVVWEETMIYLPVRVNLLLLSATIGNAQQIARWLESIRSKTFVVVEELGRPVPLHYLFFYPTGTLLPFMGPKGIDKKVRTYLNRPSPPVLSRPRSLPPFGDMVRVLKKFDLLPAIFFLKSRADCDGALERCMDGVHFKGKSRMALNNRIDELTQAHPRQAGHRHMWYLRQGGVAAHHGGQLPAWKLLVENLMTKGLLDAVFATSTVAAGVNFHARSVLFFNSDRYNGHEFVPLNATEFHQMTGRAGRRGKDHVGFAVAVPGRYMDLRLVADLCTAPPEDVVSQIKVDFSMVLNLLLSHTREDVKKTFEKSFATHLSLANQEPGTNSKLKKAGDDLMTLLPEALCGRPEQVIELIRNRAALIHELA
ncbi:MAG: DEAD/DEAH box helicase, partial [Deltaproteobacteria bacterium]|nr:DEAD/DEAH box helicase [Deltaproteobacteria bacterium]